MGRNNVITQNTRNNKENIQNKKTNIKRIIHRHRHHVPEGLGVFPVP